MRTLVEMKFGSHLYGTSTPASDLDIKRVHIPDAESILFGDYPGTRQTQREKMTGEKNVAGDIDVEDFSIKKFLSLACEAQTVVIDMLFAPEDMVSFITPEWQEIQANRHRLLSSKYMSFVGYCRKQANKYGIKGSRVAATRAACNLLQTSITEVSGYARVCDVWHKIEALTSATSEHMKIVEIEQADGRKLPHWEVCDRKVPPTVRLGEALNIYKKLLDEYGSRALQAESNEGIDWKALSHAVRIGNQSIELLTTGHVTFPRPEAEHLLAIKTGQIDYKFVAAEIEANLEKIEYVAPQSRLQPEPDKQWCRDFVIRMHRDAIVWDYFDNQRP